MKRFFCIVLKVTVILCIVVLLSALFIYLQGIQYTLGLLTGSLRDPYFDGAQYQAEKNCYGNTPCSSDVIGVLTYNVFCRVCDELWDVRITHLRNLVERYNPDLIGSQELGTWKDIEEYLPEGDIYEAVTFEFGPWTYADAALFFRKSRYELLDSGQFWLSPNPGLPFGFGWLKLSAPRYLTWAYLRDRHNGFTFLFMNTHLDNNPMNKEASAPLIFKTFAPYAERMPIIFTGDFNTNPTTERYTVLRQGTGEQATGRITVLRQGTGNQTIFFNAADIVQKQEMQLYQEGTAIPADRTYFTNFMNTIDHIFLAGPVEKEVREWVVDYNEYDVGQRASDHPAVFAKIQLTLTAAQ
jgi:endonuclease/exonuclease/phosphatase family metal-dependent hydrolase